MSDSSEQVSYRVHQVATNVDAEIKRLKGQVDLFWDKEIKMYRNFGLIDGMKVLECGSGPGYVMEKIISNFPNSHVTGIETDPYLVETATKRFDEKAINRFEVMQQSIMELEFTDNSFDFAVTRLVLEHLPDPVGAIKEVYRILKPGGKAVFVDNDFEMHLRTFPGIPELSQLYDAYCTARISEGGNPRIGRELPGIIKKCGFKKVDLEIIAAHSEIVGDEIFQRSEGSGIPAKLVEDGYLSRDLLDTIASKWYEMLQMENHAILRQLYIVGGEKGTHDHEKNIAQKEKQKIDHKKTPKLKSIINTNHENKQQIIANYLSELIACSLNIPKSSLAFDIPIIELGFDSLMAIQLKNNIKSDLSIDISVIDFFENKSIVAIVKVLLEKIPRDEFTKASSSTNGNKQLETEWDEGEI